MTNTTIRQIQGDEMLEIMSWLPMYAFRASPPLSDKAERQEQLRQRQGFTYFAAFEDGAPVACAAAEPFTQNVRTALFGMSGISNVATHPAARRKGHARSMLAQLWAAVRDDGQVFSCLYPFRESFYERLGYVTLPLSRKCTLKPAALLPLLKKDLGGAVEMMLIGDGYDSYHDFLCTLRPRIHGMAIFDHPDKAGAQRNRFWLALAKSGGEVVGAMLYQLSGEQIADFTMSIRRFYYLTSEGKYLLLAWIARHVDQASRVNLLLPAFEHAETWLDDLQISAEPVAIPPMGRVLDVAKIGGMHTGPGRFAARLSDPICPWNEGVWQFETAAGVLHVGPADKADCDLGIQAIAALTYGTQDPGDFAIRGWGNPSPALQETMRSMFPPLVPYLHESF